MLLQGVPHGLRHRRAAAAHRRGRVRSAASATATDPKLDVYLRVLADHARSMTFLVNDGVTPSNEDRGYVVRSVIRRAVRRAYQLGVEKPILPEMVADVIDGHGRRLPRAGSQPGHDRRRRSAGRRSASCRRCAPGSTLLDEALDRGESLRRQPPSGCTTRSASRSSSPRRSRPSAASTVDRPGFDAAMDEQRRRAREGRKVTCSTAGRRGLPPARRPSTAPTEFTGYSEVEGKAACWPSSLRSRGPERCRRASRSSSTARRSTPSRVARSATPARIDDRHRWAEVVDTTFAMPGLIRHLAVVTEGEISAGPGGARRH